MASEWVLGVGVIGFGGASLAMIPKFVQNPNFRIVAAADIDTEIMDRFRKDFQMRAVASISFTLPRQTGSTPNTRWKRIRCKRGRGTRAARRCMNSSGDMTIRMVSSLNALFSCNITWPARLRLSRSLAIAGRVI